MRAQAADRLGDVLGLMPETTTELPDDKANEVMELVARLEEDDDVQNVYSTLG